MGQWMKLTPVLLFTTTVWGIVCKSTNWIKMKWFLKEIQIYYKVSEQVNLLENLTNPSAIPILPCQFHSPRIAQCPFALLGQTMSHWISVINQFTTLFNSSNWVLNVPCSKQHQLSTFSKCMFL
jgi:hypothetical protein